MRGANGAVVWREGGCEKVCGEGAVYLKLHQ